MQKNSLLVCLKEGQWLNDHIGHHAAGPKKEEIVTLDAISDNGYLHLVEYPCCVCGCGNATRYDSIHFREIQPPMSIPESLFNQSPEKVTV